MSTTVSTPCRIQRQRVKGWRMPEGAIYVGRPTKWGNPFRFRTMYGLARVPALNGSAWEHEGRISADGALHPYCHPGGRITEHHVRYMTREECVSVYRRALVTPTPHLNLRYRHGAPWLTVDDVRRELAGRDLACWCPLSEPCHADVLLEIANGGSQ